MDVSFLSSKFDLYSVVEMAGIEPASENRLPRLSTSVACVLSFPLSGAHRQAPEFSSL